MTVKKTLFLLFTKIVSNTHLISQNNSSNTISKIKKFLYSYAVSPNSKNTGKNMTVYYNKVENIIDIDNCRIPLLDVKISYYYYKDTDNHCVSFDCKNKVKCIIAPEEEEVLATMLPFKTKKNCYDFIELVNQLKL